MSVPTTTPPRGPGGRIVRRMLLVAPSWVGDTVLAQPLMMRLHERHPGLLLDVLAAPALHALLSRMPQVSEIIDNPFRHGELRVFARRRLGVELRSRRYDAAIVLPNSLKSALPPYFAAIPVRTGYRGELRGGLLNDVRVLDERRLPLMVERFAALADEARAPLYRPLPRPQLRVDSRARAALMERFGLAAAQPVVAFCPGAEYGPAKRWPAEYFGALAQRLSTRGRRIWLFGSGGEREIGEEIERCAPGIQIDNLCGRTQLDEAIDLLSAAAVVVTNDSGLMHVAAALGRPLVALYGSSSPKFTPPLASDARVLQITLPCSPCFERVCPLGHFRCMRELDPDQVADAAEAAAAAGGR